MMWVGWLCELHMFYFPYSTTEEREVGGSKDHALMKIQPSHCSNPHISFAYLSGMDYRPCTNLVYY